MTTKTKSAAGKPAPAPNPPARPLDDNTLDALESLRRTLRSLEGDVKDAVRAVDSVVNASADAGSAEEAAKEQSEFVKAVIDSLTTLREECVPCRNEPENGIGRCRACVVMAEIIRAAP